jgi:hypothetical protein
VKHLSGAPLYGRLLALIPNITLGWKGLPGINPFAYYERSSITAVKSFIKLLPVSTCAISSNRMDAADAELVPALPTFLFITGGENRLERLWPEIFILGQLKILR